MSVDSVSIGKKIKRIRLENGLTQVEFARIFNMNQQNLSRYENGNTQISYTDLINIVNYFRIPIGYFFDLEEDEIREDERLLLVYYRKINLELRPHVLKMVKVISEGFPEEAGVDKRRGTVCGRS